MTVSAEYMLCTAFRRRNDVSTSIELYTCTLNKFNTFIVFSSHACICCEDIIDNICCCCDVTSRRLAKGSNKIYEDLPHNFQY